MNKKKKIIIIITTILVIVLSILGIAYHIVFNTDVLFNNQISSNAQKADAVHQDLLDNDEINIMVVGTGNPMGQGRAQSSVAVFVGGQFLLFDAGDNAQSTMESLNVPVEELDAVFLTHFHGDHIADLGEVISRSYILQRENELTIYGPTGTKQIVEAFNTAYEFDYNYRTAHHGEELMPSDLYGATAIEFDAEINDAVIYEKDGVKVTAFKGEHPPVEPNFGYTIEYMGKKVVVSGDTLITENLKEQSMNADLLVCDVMNYEVTEKMENGNAEIGNEVMQALLHDIREYHPDVADIGKLATECNIENLALYHFSPPPSNDFLMNSWYVNPIKEYYNGNIFTGEDGLTITLPLD